MYSPDHIKGSIPYNWYPTVWYLLPKCRSAAEGSSADFSLSWAFHGTPLAPKRERGDWVGTRSPRNLSCKLLCARRPIFGSAKKAMMQQTPRNAVAGKECRFARPECTHAVSSGGLVLASIHEKRNWAV